MVEGAMFGRSAFAVRPRLRKLMLLGSAILRKAAQFSGLVAENK